MYNKGEALKARPIRGGHDMPFYECWGCGTLVLTADNPQIRIYCPDCKREHPQKLESKRQEYLRLRAELMWERALRFIEKQEARMYLYQEAAKVVREKALNDVEAFDSAHEMIAAMELLRVPTKIKIHPTVGRHKPDIMLPNEKAILEIDGYMHKHIKKQDYKRDIKMRQVLGPDWEVIRIPTKYLERNSAALYRAIKEMKRHQQKLRRQYNGLLPPNYSKRDAAVWKKVMEM